MPDKAVWGFLAFIGIFLILIIVGLGFIMSGDTGKEVKKQAYGYSQDPYFQQYYGAMAPPTDALPTDDAEEEQPEEPTTEMSTIGYIYLPEKPDISPLLMYGRPRYDQAGSNIWEYRVTFNNLLSFLAIPGSSETYMKRLASGDQVIFSGSTEVWTVDTDQNKTQVLIDDGTLILDEELDAGDEDDGTVDDGDTTEKKDKKKQRWYAAEIIFLVSFCVAFALGGIFLYTKRNTTFSLKWQYFWWILMFSLVIIIVSSGAALNSFGDQITPKKYADSHYDEGEIVTLVVIGLLLIFLGAFPIAITPSQSDIDKAVLKKDVNFDLGWWHKLKQPASRFVPVAAGPPGTISYQPGKYSNSNKAYLWFFGISLVLWILLWIIFAFTGKTPGGKKKADDAKTEYVCDDDGTCREYDDTVDPDDITKHADMDTCTAACDIANTDDDTT